MSKALNEVIVKTEKLNNDIFRMTIHSPFIANKALPGQFVNIKCEDGLNSYLRRPISICGIDKTNETFVIAFQVKGKGTSALSKKSAGDYLDIMGPLGRGFDISKKYKNIIAVGGGIGIFPLLNLLKSSKAIEKTALLGFRNKDAVVMESEFKNVSDKLVISTDDGSFGRHGFVTGSLADTLREKKADIIYVCGPEAMIKNVVRLAYFYGVSCQISLEQRMGCGIGACLVCACETADEDHPDGWDYSHVCKDGPVFWSREVIFNEL